MCLVSLLSLSNHLHRRWRYSRCSQTCCMWERKCNKLLSDMFSANFCKSICPSERLRITCWLSLHGPWCKVCMKSGEFDVGTQQLDALLDSIKKSRDLHSGINTSENRAMECAKKSTVDRESRSNSVDILLEFMCENMQIKPLVGSPLYVEAFNDRISHTLLQGITVFDGISSVVVLSASNDTKKREGPFALSCYQPVSNGR